MTKNEMTGAGQVVERIMAATNAQDMDEYLAAQHPEIELVLPGGITARGHDQVRQYIQAQWTAFPDGHVTRLNQIATDDQAATEIALTATHSGLLNTPNGPVPPTGKRINVRFVAVHRIKDGMATSEHVYFDQLDTLMQLGLMPAV
jgi:ketosteroid isomerase-like protein